MPAPTSHPTASLLEGAESVSFPIFVQLVPSTGPPSVPTGPHSSHLSWGPNQKREPSLGLSL